MIRRTLRTLTRRKSPCFVAIPRFMATRPASTSRFHSPRRCRRVTTRCTSSVAARSSPAPAARSPCDLLCPHPAQEGSTSGAAAQLYGVRSDRNWGIGDFTDLATLSEQWGARGAGIVGVSPLHALFPQQPWRASPYSPSSRLFRNTLYLDVEAIADYYECAEARAQVASAEFQATLAALRGAPLVDYAGVAAAKRSVVELLYRHFREHHLAPGGARANAFREYVAAGGDALHHHALFEALQEHFRRDDPAVWGWPAWPASYRDPAAPASRASPPTTPSASTITSTSSGKPSCVRRGGQSRASSGPVGRPLCGSRRLHRSRRRRSVGESTHLCVRR